MISEDPKGDTNVPSKSVITLTVTSNSMVVPSLSGMTVDQAQTALQNLGLVLGKRY